jgi:two-component system phosphate regulon response regulator PhoB
MRQFAPHLVLLDVMMPKMTGFEVVRRIRRDRRFRSVPIVLIIAYDNPFMERGWRLGADDFIYIEKRFTSLPSRPSTESRG